MTHPIATPRRRWLAGVALAAAFVAGGVTLPSLAASAQESAHGAMMGAAGHGEMMAHVARMLDAVGASADQKARIAEILHTGLKPMMEAHARLHDTHAALHALLAAPTIDRDALERLRAGEIAQIDQASKSMVQALADAAEVLRPDQRAKLVAMAGEGH